MLKIKSIFFVVFFLSISMASAVSTSITVETVPFTDVTISILEPTKTYSSIHSFYNKPSGESGIVTVTYDGNMSEFGLAVYVTLYGTPLYNKRFSDYFTAGVPVVVQVPEKENNTENSGITNNSNGNGDNSTGNSTSNNSTDGNSTIENKSDGGITGKVIASTGSNGKTVYYVIAIAILALGILVSVFARRVRGRSTNEGPVPSSAPPVTKVAAARPKMDTQSKATSGSVSIDELKMELEETRRGLEDARGKLNVLENRDRIAAMERKLENDRRELERLRGGRR